MDSLMLSGGELDKAHVRLAKVFGDEQAESILRLMHEGELEERLGTNVAEVIRQIAVGKHPVTREI